jgi:hypothetical protein
MVKLILIFAMVFDISFSYGNLKKSNAAYFLNHNAYSLNFSEYVFQTTGYFDYKGNENPLPADTSFQLVDSSFGLSYGLAKNIEVFLSGNIRHVSSNVVVANNIKSATKTGIESGAIGFKYQFEPMNSIFYAIGFHYRKFLFANSRYISPQVAPTDTVILGDDGREFGVHLYSTLFFNSNRLDSELGYLSPAEYLSQEIDYKFELIHQFEKFGLILGVTGDLSLKRDPYANDPVNKPLMSNGATSLFNSTNREMFRPYIGSLYDFKKVSFEARGGLVFNGTSTDKGYFALLNLSYATSGITDESLKVDSFKEYHIEGSVLKVSPRGNIVKIDQGLSTDVEKGMNFDIYQTDYFGGNLLVASGYVLEIGVDWSIVKLVKKFTEVEIKPGFAARGK